MSAYCVGVTKRSLPRGRSNPICAESDTRGQRAPKGFGTMHTVSMCVVRSSTTKNYREITQKVKRNTRPTILETQCNLKKYFRGVRQDATDASLGPKASALDPQKHREPNDSPHEGPEKKLLLISGLHNRHFGEHCVISLANGGI